jgi:catechol 2,3-dioxygenase-like lactoylglutathione lyase family enzyme
VVIEPLAVDLRVAGTGRHRQARRHAEGLAPAAREADHVCLRVADLDEASARWQIEFGLVERSREDGRALLACNDEPYCLELVEGGRPGHNHSAFELTPDCSLDDARAHLGKSGVACEEREGCLFVADPDGRAVQLMPHRPAATEVDRWPQHARPSSTVHIGGPRKLGHVNCLTGDIQRNAAFYVDVLGMRVSDWLDEAGVWFHIGTDHHVMALVERGYAHFHHLAFEYDMSGTAGGSSFVCDGVDIIVFSDGLVARKDTYLDLVSLERQTGPLPQLGF